MPGGCPVAPSNPIAGQQLLFHRFRVSRGVSQPGPNGLFLVPFDACQAADPIPFGQQSQGFKDLIFRRATPIEDRAFGFGKCAPARAAQVALATGPGLATFHNVLLMFPLSLAMVGTGLIGTEIAYVGKFRHPDPLALRMPP